MTTDELQSIALMLVSIGLVFHLLAHVAAWLGRRA